MKFTIVVFDIEKDLIKREKQELEKSKKELIKSKKKPMKKGTHWFAFLSEKEQKEFRENCAIDGFDFHKFIELEFRTFYHFCSGAFSWTKTNQSLEYWSNIANRNVR